MKLAITTVAFAVYAIGVILVHADGHAKSGVEGGTLSGKAVGGVEIRVWS